jgi:hypothetical protein
VGALLSKLSDLAGEIIAIILSADSFEEQYWKGVRSEE